MELDYDFGDDDDDGLFDYYDEEEGVMFPDEYSIMDLWNDCIVPSMHDGLDSSLRLLVFCFLLRLTLCFGFLPHHLASIFLGLCSLYGFFGVDMAHVVSFAIIGFLSVHLAKTFFSKYLGIFSALVCYGFLILCELFFRDKVLWHRIRGCQMILCMKLISLSFDVGCEREALPSPSSFFGYLFHPGTVVFGPWTSFSVYSTGLQHNTQFKFGWFCSIFRSLVCGYVFLTISTCWTTWIFYFSLGKWMDAYRDALSFRSSHYFVSYLSEATMAVSGIRGDARVTSASRIEVPRSLVEVVVWWNVPMHTWLKTYVFKAARPLGAFAAILLTYSASSLLHGLNFQLAAVLLSLGFYTYVEHVLRLSLGSIFSACILARRCKPNCDHTFKSNNVYVATTNIAFGLLAMFHLTYLGVMFDSTEDIEEQGYNMRHTLKKWGELGYASHWIALIAYGMHCIIK